MIVKPIIEEPIDRGKTGLPQRVENFLAQARKELKLVERGQYDLTTAQTNTLTAIWTSEMVPPSTQALVYAQVIGRSSDGTVYAAYDKAALFYRGATGAAAQQGSTQDRFTPIESDAALDCTFSVSSSLISLNVSDGNQGTVLWRAWVTALVRG